MKKRTLFIGAAGGLLILAILIVVIAQPQRRGLSRGANPDGTVTVMIGQKRVFGLMGIEIIRQHEDHRGSVLSASVKGECRSWVRPGENLGRRRSGVCEGGLAAHVRRLRREARRAAVTPFPASASAQS